jgi:RimJ/RimL family protein N-acetyltransferase
VSPPAPRIIAQTDRLTLRELTLDDVDRLFEVLGDPIAMQHYPAPKTRLETEAWIRLRNADQAL